MSKETTAVALEPSVVPFLGIDEGIAVEPRNLTAALRVARLGVHQAAEVGRKEALHPALGEPLRDADRRRLAQAPAEAVRHLDEVNLKVDGHSACLWRAVDAEGQILDLLVQAKRNKHAALKLIRKLLRKYGFVPDLLITDDLRSYGAAARELGIEKNHGRGRWRNDRAENSHQPIRRRERKMQGFKSRDQPRDFIQPTLPSTTLSNVQRHLTSAQTHRGFRIVAMETWRAAVAVA